MKNVAFALAIGGIVLILAQPGDGPDDPDRCDRQTTADMIRMQRLTSDFTTKTPASTVKWVTLEEKRPCRQRVTTDIATKGGQVRPF